MKKYLIKDINAIEILDSRGTPTIQTTVTLYGGSKGVAGVPSGASTGKYEAHELRDGDKKRYNGKGTLTAVNNVNTTIKQALLKKRADNQREIDDLLIKLDGTHNKSNLGANAILSVSIAVARAVANQKDIPLYEYLGPRENRFLPTPMCNIINGGAHANNNLDIQEFMVMPTNFETFSEALRAGAEIFASLKKILSDKGMPTSVGDEGGFAPNLKSHEEALDLVMQSITLAGYKPGVDVYIALDAAAADWMQKDGNYLMPKSQLKFTPDELINYWKELSEKYPIISLEDPLGEDDFVSFTKLTNLLGDNIQIVGDDLYVTNTERLLKGIKEKSSNSVLIKPNQIGTITETLNAIKMAQENEFTTVISHRSGETEDSTIADIAVATNSTQIKTGSLSRSDRVSKYNRLLTIENELGDKVIYSGLNAFYNINKTV